MYLFCTQTVHIFTLSLSLSLSNTLSDDDDTSLGSKRSAVYAANTVSQIASRKDYEPDRMEIDNTFGESAQIYAWSHGDPLPNIDFVICVAYSGKLGEFF